MNRDERIKYYEDRAIAYGLPKEELHNIVNGEGGWDSFRQSGIRRSGKGSYNGYESSFGPLQAYEYGQGGDFTRTTGLDYKDPKNEKALADYQIKIAADMYNKGIPLNKQWYGYKGSNSNTSKPIKKNNIIEDTPEDKENIEDKEISNNKELLAKYIIEDIPLINSYVNTEDIWSKYFA